MSLDITPWKVSLFDRPSLEYYDVRGTAGEWFRSYFKSNRKQFVTIGNLASERGTNRDVVGIPGLSPWPPFFCYIQTISIKHILF